MYIQEVKVERDKFKTHCNSLLELLSKYEFALTNVGRQFTEMKKKGRFIIKPTRYAWWVHDHREKSILQLYQMKNYLFMDIEFSGFLALV